MDGTDEWGAEPVEATGYLSLAFVFAVIGLPQAAMVCALLALVTAGFAVRRVNDLADRIEQEKAKPQAAAIARLPDRPPDG